MPAAVGPGHHLCSASPVQTDLYQGLKPSLCKLSERGIERFVVIITSMFLINQGEGD